MTFGAFTIASRKCPASLPLSACARSFARARGALHVSLSARQIYPGSEIHILSMTRYPYRIYYTVSAVAVVILHIRHTARLDPDLGELGE